MKKKKGVSVCFIIKNGVSQGYPFWESLESCLSFADEVVISEGCSTDGTSEYIRKFVSTHSNMTKFRVYSDDWNSFSTSCGEVIAKVSDKNMRRCEYEWVYYLQADEILHPENSEFVRRIAETDDGYNAVRFPFYHFINSWTPIPRGQVAYDYAIRMVKNRKDIHFLGDAWTFHGHVEPTCHQDMVPKPIYHLGWVFPKNIDIKHIEHERLYPTMTGYKNSADGARKRMEKAEYSGLPKSDTFDDYPPGIERLFGKLQYDLPDGVL